MLETFSKMSKFWGPIPAFLCSWLNVLMIRPGDVAINILICAQFTVATIVQLIGFAGYELHDIQIQIFTKFMAFVYLSMSNWNILLKLLNIFFLLICSSYISR